MLTGLDEAQIAHLRKSFSAALGLSLKGQGNQIAEPALGHDILRGKQPVIREER